MKKLFFVAMAAVAMTFTACDTKKPEATPDPTPQEEAVAEVAYADSLTAALEAKDAGKIEQFLTEIQEKVNGAEAAKYKDQLAIVVIAGRKRITKESFERWYAEYKKELPKDVKPRKQTPVRKSGSDLYYTLDEVREICCVSKSTVLRWVDNGCFPIKKISHYAYIPRQKFDTWYEQYKQERERSK